MARKRHSGFQGDVTHDGKRFRASGFATEAAARVWEHQAMANLLVGKPVPPGPSAGEGSDWTLKEMLDYVLKEHWAKTSANPKAFEYKCDVIVEDLGPDYPAADLALPNGYDALVAACRARGNSGGTINQKTAILSKALKFSIEKGKLVGVQKPQFARQKGSTGRERILSRDEEQRCLAWLRQCDPEMADWFVVALDTGVRSYSEGLHIFPFVDIRGRDLFIRGRLLDEALDVANVVDLGAARRRIKTGEGQSRVVGLTKRALAIVEDHKRRLHNDRGAKLFASLSAGHIVKRWVEMKDALEIKDKHFVPYSLRHTFGTRMILAGETVPNVATLMGHSNLKQTWRYVHLAGLIQKGAVDKLEKWQEQNSTVAEEG